MHAGFHAYKNLCMPTHTHMQAHIHARTRMCTHTHTHTHTHMHTHTHTHDAHIPSHTQQRNSNTPSLLTHSITASLYFWPISFTYLFLLWIYKPDFPSQHFLTHLPQELFQKNRNIFSSVPPNPSLHSNMVSVGPEGGGEGEEGRKDSYRG